MKTKESGLSMSSKQALSVSSNSMSPGPSCSDFSCCRKRSRCWGLRHCSQDRLIATSGQAMPPEQVPALLAARPER
jgi:hypothetical protein